jgi:hypothetical protein
VNLFESMCPNLSEYGAVVEWYSWENQRTQIETCINATLAATNTTWTNLGMNLDCHSEELATNYLSYGMAIKIFDRVIHFPLGRKNWQLILHLGASQFLSIHFIKYIYYAVHFVKYCGCVW